MTLLEIMTFICFMAFINILSFIVGARVGQKVVRGESIETPLRSPLNVVSEVKDSFEQRKIQEREKIIAENIDNYSGTSLGQKDVPRL